MQLKVFNNASHIQHCTDRYLVPPDNEVILELPARVDQILLGLKRVVAPLICTAEDKGIAPIESVHSSEYINFLNSAYREEIQLHPNRQVVGIDCMIPKIIRHRSSNLSFRKGLFLTDTFTSIFDGTFEAAYWAAQSAIAGADLMLAGETCAYALVRPPGHHAYRDQGGGFCFFNNVAVAAAYLQKSRAECRVAILDIDFHHGNGTQEIFYDNSQVLFCSIHGDPDYAYPYVSGAETEVGVGPGEGCNLNIPLSQGCGDSQYLVNLEKVCRSVQDHKPDYLLVSLGFDIAKGDPYGKFMITRDGFRAIGRVIRSMRIPTLFVQEGGYLIDSLANNSEAFFSGYLE